MSGVPDPLDRAHHDGSALYLPEGEPQLGQTVPAFVRVPDAAAPASVHLRTVRDGEPHYTEAVVDRRTGGETWYRAELEARNLVTSYRFLLATGAASYAWLTAAGVAHHDVTDGSDFRLDLRGGAPDWTRDAVIYQIFPDRFDRGGTRPDADDLPDWAVPAGWDDRVEHRGPNTPRQLFGGDLPGVTKRLDYLADLGVTAVYLTPVFPARSNHRYDASTFTAVDPLLGGDAALAELSDALHRRGMRLIGDLTTNHSGAGHEWFRRALADPASEEAGFYYFNEHPHDYVAWFDVPSLPKLNYTGAGVRRRLVEGPDSVVARWLRPPYALDGWRIDVANMTGRHRGDDLNASVARAVRATMAAVNPQAYLVAEHVHDASDDLAAAGWHGVMNYSGFAKPVWTWLTRPDHGLRFFGMPVGYPRFPGPDVVRSMREFAARVAWSTLRSNMVLLGSHDTPRIRTIVGDPALVEVAAGLLFTYPGVPMLFMGDELGLEGVDGEDSRRPMPWHRPETWDRPTLDAYRRLIGLRHRLPALRRGGLRWVHVGDDVLVYLRETAEQRVLVLAARAPHPPVRLPLAGLGLAGSHETPANVYGGQDAVLRGDLLQVGGDGPTFQVWLLEG